jgi:hypothetical protein
MGTARWSIKDGGMENNMTENKKGFLQNDRLLVCSMLTFYGLCLIGLIAATFWWLDRSRQVVSANETATAVINATQQVHATSTAVARSTEQAQYEFIERFQARSNLWFVGPRNNEYWIGDVSIKDGAYIWNVEEVKKPFLWAGDFHMGANMKDFDVYVDTKFKDGFLGNVCSGLVFRKSPNGWDAGAYTFSICNDSSFRIFYYDKDQWDPIADWASSDAIRTEDWNRIEVSARGNKLKFTINHTLVFEATDDRQKQGGLAVFIAFNEERPSTILFDNFGYQSR